MSTTLVFDASAAVKWFRPQEVGATAARSMLEDSTSDVWLPDNCVHEIVHAVARRRSAAAATGVWDALAAADVLLGRVDGELVTEALVVSQELGCDYYDALAPALARLLGGTLVSADRRAHSGFPGVLLVA